MKIDRKLKILIKKLFRFLEKIFYFLTYTVFENHPKSRILSFSILAFSSEDRPIGVKLEVTKNGIKPNLNCLKSNSIFA